MTIVVSPLIALIKDQMEHLARRNIVSESINSKLGERDRKRVLDDLRSRSPSTKLLYVTPEQCRYGQNGIYLNCTYMHIIMLMPLNQDFYVYHNFGPHGRILKVGLFRC